MKLPLIKSSLSLTHLIVFLLLLGTIGCQKEGSKEIPGNFPGAGTGGGGNSGGSAQFSLMPSGSNCSDAVITGTYQEGIALGIDAVLVVTVDVKKTGDWTYSTAVVNGFLFAGGGTFTATGAQMIILQAAGKPKAAVNFYF